MSGAFLLPLFRPSPTSGDCYKSKSRYNAAYDCERFFIYPVGNFFSVSEDTHRWPPIAETVGTSAKAALILSAIIVTGTSDWIDPKLIRGIAVELV